MRRTIPPEWKAEPLLVIWIGRPMSLAWVFQQELCPKQVSPGSRSGVESGGWDGNTVRLATTVYRLKSLPQMEGRGWEAPTRTKICSGPFGEEVVISG